MVKIIDEEFGREVAVDTISKAFTLGTVHLSRRGYTIALQDINVSDKVKKITQEIVAEAEKKTTEIIKKEQNGELEIIPGKTLEETRETRILQILNDVRTEVAKVVSDNFPHDANLNKMIA